MEPSALKDWENFARRMGREAMRQPEFESFHVVVSECPSTMPVDLLIESKKGLRFSDVAKAAKRVFPDTLEFGRQDDGNPILCVSVHWRDNIFVSY